VDLFNEGVRLFSEKKPSRIATLIGSRTGEQVRERIKHLRKRSAAAAAAAAGEQEGAASATAAPAPPGESL
jgi:ribosomal protein L12E/L44/L45/RPP1/RPP2